MAVVQVNNKAGNLFYNAISGEEYEKISSFDEVKEMWDKLEVTYEGTSKVKETHINMLVHDYELFQMKEGESIEEMFARFSKIISDLKAFGKPYSSGDQVRKILRSLPTTWQTKVVTLESQDLNKLSCDELRGELIAFKKTYLKKTNQEEKKKTVAFKATREIAENDINDDLEALQEEIAMMSRNMDGLMRRFRNTRRGRIPPRQTRQYNEQDKNDGKCYECGKFEHIQAECPDLQRKISRGFNKNKSFRSWSDEDSSEHEEVENLCFIKILKNDMNKLSGCWTNEDISDDECKDNNENCFMARGETSKEHHRRNRKGKWYLDSACSSHMTDNKSLFKEVTKIDGESVKFGDDSKGKIIGIRMIPFNNNCDITEVYLVDGLNYNLLSISQLCDLGYEVKFKKTCCAIEDETGKTILPGKRYGNAYILNGFENIDGHICLTSISDDPWLSHRKLGHASMHLIEKISKHDLVIGLPKLNFSRNHICDACQIGKQTRNSFKNKDIVSTSKPLQLLHMDLFGPTRTASIGGKRYAFVIVDD
uniref:CCHC-type domain-containing protein n=1 Tax=Nicotiana tabacum TaxID=4097 RepID=A0A1S3YHC7_TOBAC|nr:PREDICTED: uncharacterized protein LOC107776052 [Nicotiana tabacum]